MTSRLLPIIQPDDWHVHLRDGAMLHAVLPWTQRQMGRAIIMPNLAQPITSTELALGYRARILASLAPGDEFVPLMTCYLTDTTQVNDLTCGFEQGVLIAAKLYPAHATTNAAQGVSNLANLEPVLARLQTLGMPLLIHGEVTDPDVDIFDREKEFIKQILTPMREKWPDLKIVLEHITTNEAIEFVNYYGKYGKTAATITAHHLFINRTHIFQGGLQPHHYCLPVAKREWHRRALRAAATSGSPWFFLGTDSAPHPIEDKERACGCAGIFTAPTAIELYAQAFDEDGALDRLEAFASINGPRFYGLPVNNKMIILERGPQVVPDRVSVGKSGAVLPFRAGQTLNWRIQKTP